MHLLQLLTQGKREIIIENIAVKRRIDLSLTSANIISYTAVSIFLPYILTAIILTFLSIYIIVNNHTRQLVFVHSGSRMLKLFFIYILAVPFLYRNWLGFVVGVGMILVLILGLYLRSVMTKELYERIMTLVCALSFTSTGYAMTEAFFNILDDGVNNHRISSVFAHPNYFGTIAGTVIIICVYKLLTSGESKWFFYFVAMSNIISMYLCKSMFAFVEVFIGIAVLLVVMKKHRLFTMWISFAAIGAFLIFIIGIDLIPRLYDVSVTLKIRQNIWKLAMEQIKIYPFFGHGFMSFRYLSDAAFQNRRIPHSHNIYLDMLLNFGITGSILFLWYFIRYYISVIMTCFKQGKATVAALIFAVTAAALVHGTTDLTLLWIQTLPLFLLILAGQGSEEKTEQYARGIELF